MAPAATSDPETAAAVRAFLARLEGRFVEALLYGSRARGDHGPESDADVAVILEGQRRISRAAAATEMADAAHDVLLETGIFIQPFPIWESEWNQPDRSGNSAIFETIRREGLRF